VDARLSVDYHPLFINPGDGATSSDLYPLALQLSPRRVGEAIRKAG